MSRQLLALFRIAARNLLARKANWVVGLLVVVSTFVLVVLGTLRAELQASTERSLVGSFVGHAQLFSSHSTGKLAVYSDTDDATLEPIPHFQALQARLEQVDNVRAIVPMSKGTATFVSGNLLDELLGRLRRLEADPSAAGGAEEAALMRHIRRVVQLLAGDLQTHHGLVDLSLLDEGRAALLRANTDAFWADFARAPFDHLEPLEDKVAPLLAGSGRTSLNLIGLDLDALARTFENVEVVDGTAVPHGERGLLLSKFVYEENFKLKVAHLIDQIQEGLDRGRDLATDSELQRWAEQVKAGVPELTLHDTPDKAAQALAGLQAGLHLPASTPLDQALTALLTLDASNFAERSHLFYQVVAPAVDLYSVQPGDWVPLQAQARSGYSKSLRVRFFGTYKLRGLPAADPPANQVSLIDRGSMTELLGFKSAADAAEIERILSQVQIAPMTPAELEAGIAAEAPVSKTVSATAPLDDPPAVAARAESAEPVVLNAAVWLKDPSRGAETRAALERVIQEEHLELTVVPWKQAAGSMSTVAAAVGITLVVVVAVLFLIVGFVLNNTVTMLTLQRVREFGTLRAIGGSRRFVLSLVLLESGLSTVLFGGLGAALAGWVLHLLGKSGIPSPDAALDFIFGGVRLHPSLSGGPFLLALAAVIGVGIAASLYPAVLATRVAPLVAMQSED